MRDSKGKWGSQRRWWISMTSTLKQRLIENSIQMQNIPFEEQIFRALGRNIYILQADNETWPGFQVRGTPITSEHGQIRFSKSLIVINKTFIVSSEKCFWASNGNWTRNLPVRRSNQWATKTQITEKTLNIVGYTIILKRLIYYWWLRWSTASYKFAVPSETW